MTKHKHPADRGSRIKTSIKKAKVNSFVKETKQERSARIQKKLAQESATSKEYQDELQEWLKGTAPVDSDG